ncbi:hypothetical protein C8R48DRAFT_781762 [Suillus tomentosus]|nr:hypothetical protein C8R48DRAFT_781762 [Suillus tomentosus]
MKDKEPTSLKTITQSTCPHPTTPRPPSHTPRTEPCYLPPNTPTPIHHEISGPNLQTDLLVYKEFSITTFLEVLAANATPSDLSSSMHTPGNAMVDQPMSTPHNPPPTHTQSAEEDNILVHLALAEANRSVLSQNGMNHRTILPQFTPMPVGSFPTVHMAHSAQVFDYLDNKVLLAWFQVDRPKFMVRVFDHSGNDIAEKTAITAERIRASIAIIADYIHQDSPHPFLVHKVSEETRDLIISQCIWSTADITFEVLPFHCTNPPKLLLCLSGFTTPDTETISKTVADVWSHDEHRHNIDDIFSMCGFQDDELVYKATRDLIQSIHVEMLNFKITGRLSVPRFNIFTASPTNDAKTWTNLRGYLHLLEYPTGLDGCGTAAALYPCQICHSLAHPHGLCPFPHIPQWNGPKLQNRNMTNSAHQPGRSRGGRPGHAN